MIFTLAGVPLLQGLGRIRNLPSSPFVGLGLAALQAQLSAAHQAQLSTALLRAQLRADPPEPLLERVAAEYAIPHRC